MQIFIYWYDPSCITSRRLRCNYRHSTSWCYTINTQIERKASNISRRYEYIAYSSFERDKNWWVLEVLLPLQFLALFRILSLVVFLVLSSNGIDAFFEFLSFSRDDVDNVWFNVLFEEIYSFLLFLFILFYRNIRRERRVRIWSGGEKINNMRRGWNV